MARNVDDIHLLTADSPQDAISDNCEFSAKTIIDRYGADTLRNLRRLEKIRISKGKKIAHLSFLKKCRDSHTIPTFARISHHLRSNRNNHIFDKMSLMLIQDQIRGVRFTIHKLDCELFELHLLLSNTLDKILCEYWDCCTYYRANVAFEKTAAKHISN